ncbi:MAG: ABC transporter [Clostridia bacterium]|nr:ABC transporter [Clostridia bacterium]
MGAVFKREMRAYFTMPIGYIVIAVMLLLTGMYFSYMCQSSYANITFVFSSISSIALLIAPIITMRLFSEDRKQKVDQALFTAPVKLISIVLGKFFAAISLFMLPLTITLVYQIILSFVADVNWLIYLSDLLGIALMGGAILSIGIFISALTESQMIAGIFGIGVSFFIMQIDYFSSAVNAEWFTKFCTSISFIARFNAFASGKFDFSNVIFFLSVVTLFLYFTHLVLDKKRWA